MKLQRERQRQTGRDEGRGERQKDRGRETEREGVNLILVVSKIPAVSTRAMSSTTGKEFLLRQCCHSEGKLLTLPALGTCMCVV